MSLYNDSLHDPYLLWPSDASTADQMSKLRRMFKTVAGPPPETGLPGQQQAAAPAGLSGYGLAPNPFSAPPRRAQPAAMPRPMMQPPTPAEDTTGQNINAAIAMLRRLGTPQQQEDPAAAAARRADDALANFAATRALLAQTYGGRLPQGYDPRDTGPQSRSTLLPSWHPPAMTPFEGPDTGAENPNALGAGAPRGYYAALRGPEGTRSNFDAVNPVSNATGPYQFLESTWRDIMNKDPNLGLTMEGFRHPSEHPEQHDAAIRYYTDQSVNALTKKLGRAPTAGEVYALHLLGHQGGMDLINNLDKPVGSVVPQAAIDANPWMRAYKDLPGSALLKHLNEWMSE